MKRKNFIDGITLLGFALILSGLATNLKEGPYLFISHNMMFLGLSIGAFFTLFCGAAVLLNLGRFVFKE